jgi:hypothetical protein
MLTVLSVTNPEYTSANNDGIHCYVAFAEFANNPTLANSLFHATSWDPEPHGQQLYADLKSGKYGPVAPYVPPPVKANTANGQPVSSGTQTV